MNLKLSQLTDFVEVCPQYDKLTCPDWMHIEEVGIYEQLEVIDTASCLFASCINKLRAREPHLYTELK